MTAWALAVALVLVSAPASAQMYMGLASEGFTKRPTCTTARAGDYHDPETWACGHVPGPLEWADIEHDVTQSLTITIGTLYIGPTASLASTNGGIELVFSDVPVRDESQFDTGLVSEARSISLKGTPKTAWTTTTTGLSAGAAFMEVKDCAGWRTGDRVLLADTREARYSFTENMRPEVRTISTLFGCRVTFNTPLTHDYPTARDHNQVVERTIPVGNLTRDYVIRSANPNGTRAHALFTGAGRVDLQYVAFQDMGRTNIDSIMHDTTNKIGRYAGCHFHHLTQPGSQCVGVVVERAKKHGFVLHDTNEQIFRDNLCFDAYGACVYTETGDEENNLLDNNLVISVSGGGRFSQGSFNLNGPGGDGACFELWGMRNIVTRNVGANCEIAGFEVWNTGSRGAHAIKVFTDNEAIGNTWGLSFWTVGAFGTPSVVDHFMEWHNSTNGLYMYEQRDVEFRDWYGRSDPSYSVAAGTRGLGKNTWFGDYDPGAFMLWTRPNIQNKDDGIVLPYGTATPVMGPGDRVMRVVDGYFYNTRDVVQFVNQTSNGRPAGAFKAEFIRPIHGNPIGTHYGKQFNAGDAITLMTVDVVDYQGVTGDSFRVFGTQQEPTALMTQTGVGNFGCPEAGLTNQQCFTTHGVTTFGELTPATAVSRARIAGKVLGGVIGPEPLVAPRNLRVVRP
jgi:hypothetical protein